MFGLHGRSAEQRLAIDSLLDPEMGIVSLGGRAGTGKSALALSAGLEALLERRQHKKIMVFRPLYAVGGQELKVARDCLRAHLAEVDVLTLGLVRDFNLGKACSLPISDRLIPELGDRRVDGRRKYLDFVRQCAGIKIWKLAIRLVQSKIEAVLSGPVNEEIRPNVEPLALSPTRGSSDLQEAVRIRNLQVSPYVLEMTTACQEGDWVISFKVVEGSATELRLSGPRELSMMQTDDETWEPEELLLSGEEYQLILSGPSGNGQIVFDLG